MIDDLAFVAAMLLLREQGHATPGEHERLAGIADAYFNRRFGPPQSGREALLEDALARVRAAVADYADAPGDALALAAAIAEQALR